MGLLRDSGPGHNERTLCECVRARALVLVHAVCGRLAVFATSVEIKTRTRSPETSKLLGYRTLTHINVSVCEPKFQRKDNWK